MASFPSFPRAPVEPVEPVALLTISLTKFLKSTKTEPVEAITPVPMNLRVVPLKTVNGPDVGFAVGPVEVSTKKL